jgi:hypothetical protein
LHRKEPERYRRPRKPPLTGRAAPIHLIEEPGFRFTKKASHVPACDYGRLFKKHLLMMTKAYRTIPVLGLWKKGMRKEVKDDSL